MWNPLSSPPTRKHHAVSFVRGTTAIIAAGVTYTDPDYGSWKTSHDLLLFDADDGNWTRYGASDGVGGAGLVDVVTNASLDRGFATSYMFGGQMYYGFGVACTTESFQSCSAYSNSIHRTNWSETRLNVDGPLRMHHVTDLPGPGRIHPAFVITSRGDLIVALGSTRYENLDDAWRYDIDAGSWSNLPSFAYAAHHPYAFHIGAVAYVGFGHGADIYPHLFRYDTEDVDAGWAACNQLPAQGRVAGAQFSHRGRGYVIGGEGALPFHYALPQNEFWEFTPTSTGGSWRPLPAAPGTGWWAPTSFIVDNTLHYALGMNRPFGSRTSAQMLAFSFELPSERNCSSLKEAFTDAGCCNQTTDDGDEHTCNGLRSEYEDRQCCEP